MLKATVLSDNVASRGLGAEWGLSILIEYGERRILLDTGASRLFAKNADKLGIRLDTLDCAVISHAHFDHANGLPALFRRVPGIRAYLRFPAAENCYHTRGVLRLYAGIRRGVLRRFSKNIVMAEGDTELFPGVHLLPHKTAGLDACGKREKMFVKRAGGFVPDDFAHEQSAVFETERGLVVFNSCCHGGAATVVREAEQTFPGQRVYALIGGFHLYNKTNEEIRALAQDLKDSGIQRIYTGHCTKDRGYEVLRDELGEDTVKRFYTGCVMEF